MNNTNLNKVIDNFSAPSTGDKIIHLSDYQGKNLILYFYPRDNTPGCTQEGKDFRDAIDEFNALNSIILGVSRDSVRVHENFKCKQELPFDLLSDKNESLCTLFNVIKMKNMYGKQVRGIERSTFLIDGNGILQYEWRKVKVKTHIQKVLEKLKELKFKI
jgi:peroxiredoxin Q/BCP